jgi:transposase-like protein/transposase
METLQTRRYISPEDKARLVLKFLRSKSPAAALCKQYKISESNYYRWKKAFVIAGIEALRRRPLRRNHALSGRSTENNQRSAATEIAKEDLRRSVEAMQTQNAARRPKLPETARLALVKLIETASIPRASAMAIARIPRSTYYRWRKAAMMNISGRKHNAAREYVRLTERKSVKEAVFNVLHSPPSDHGFNRTTWKIVDLQQALRNVDIGIGKHAIRIIIKDAGYRWRKARKVLTSTDPKYREKVHHIQSILANLRENEAFFSIDEYGPFSIRARGGRVLTGPGEMPTVPQRQKSKGCLIMTAALELSTNQISYFYSPRKDTGEMLRMLSKLVKEYRHKNRIYLSWDAASWHMSKMLYAQIAKHNDDITGGDVAGPIVDLAPLPAGAQFLNVVESVFSGMARAIIANSNYQSVDDARAAIERYVQERNKKFTCAPKRAGGKIWGTEREISRFSTSNNCKDPRYR